MVKSKVEEQDIISREQLLYLIDKIETRNTLRDKALVAFLYLTGARVSEVVRSITPLQLTEEYLHDRKFLVVYNVECLKRRENNKAKRNISINVEKESPFLKYIYNYMEKKIDPEKPLFDLSRQWAYYILKRKIDRNLFPHYLRHLRASHLTSLYGFNSSELRHFFGWSDDKPAASYVHLNWKDIARRMM